MDDLSDKISSLLSDPGSVEALKEMARSLMNSGDKKEGNTGEPGMNPADLQKIMKVMGALRSTQGDDSRTRLLLSLKPYLREERRGRIEEAVRILRLVSALPALTSSGLL